MNDKNLRYELKFEIGPASVQMLRYRLKTCMENDPHHDAGGYEIHSLYFDDCDYNAYRDKIDGLRDRSKLRLRYYNDNRDYIVLENKEKLGSLTRKRSQRVDENTALTLISGGKVASGLGEVTDLYNALTDCQLLHPSVLVSYHRQPFLYPASTVRITIDSNVRTAPFRYDLFDHSHPMIPVLENGTSILEVKYDDFLPPFLAEVLHDVPMNRIAISKYVRCLGVLE